MRKWILECVDYPRFTDDITEFVAGTAFATSLFGISSHERTKPSEAFAANTQLRKLTEDFVFTFAYMENETNRHNPLIETAAQAIKNDEEFKAKAMELKYIFMTKAEALLHKDLHTGSVMLNEQESFVIDSEFAFVGAIGFDLGAVVGNLLMASIAMEARGEAEYAKSLENMAYEVMDKFAAKYEALLLGDSGAMYENGYWANTDEHDKKTLIQKIISDILSETVGFAGADRDKGALSTAREMIIRYNEIRDAKELKELIGSIK